MARRGLGIAIVAGTTALLVGPLRALERREGAYHVYPGDRIQDAIEAAAADPQVPTVRVHAGVYQPSHAAQALIWFNRKHDGVRVLAMGEVTLTAANPELAQPGRRGYPAIVNHVVYFGDGVSSNTVLRGFRITGAAGFLTTAGTRALEPDQVLPKGEFFYADGGGIKIFGASYPTLEQLELVDNLASPCGGAISIEHPDFESRVPVGQAVTIRNCVFRGNRAWVNGAAVDVLPGSTARIENCLFVGNASNQGEDYVSRQRDWPLYSNSGVLTVFWRAQVWMSRCTFTGNRNAVDDRGTGSWYRDSIFWQNDLPSGLPGERYELDVEYSDGVLGCWIGGQVPDLRGNISTERNRLNPPTPRFDADYVPQAPEYAAVGYRPVD